MIPQYGNCQDTTRARANLKRLTSFEMKGRGYLENGAERAAKFIQNQFVKYGLLPVNGAYNQSLTISQNLFPVEPFLTINGKRQKAGLDFLPEPSCPSVKGKFTLVYADSIFLTNQLSLGTHSAKKEAWVISPFLSKSKSFRSNWKPGVWISLKAKLTHSLSEDQSETPELVLMQNQYQPADSVLNVNVQSKVKSNIETRNVLGLVKGNAVPDSFLIVCAHYDHIGMLGKEIIFPGANDNASGTSMLLEMADYFSKNPLRYSILFIAFTGEEAGLLGSQYFVNHSLVPLSKVKFVMNMDLIGFGELGATVVNATVHPDLFSKMTKINEEKGYLKEIKARGKAANSDHYPFSEAGVPAFFLYTLGGPGYYHDIQDKAETVTFSRFRETFLLLTDFLRTF